MSREISTTLPKTSPWFCREWIPCSEENWELGVFIIIWRFQPLVQALFHFVPWVNHHIKPPFGMFFSLFSQASHKQIQAQVAWIFAYFIMRNVVGRLRCPLECLTENSWCWGGCGRYTTAIHVGKMILKIVFYTTALFVFVACIYPPPSKSHYQNYCIFGREPRTKPSFATGLLGSRSNLFNLLVLAW